MNPCRFCGSEEPCYVCQIDDDYEDDEDASPYEEDYFDGYEAEYGNED